MKTKGEKKSNWGTLEDIEEQQMGKDKKKWYDLIPIDKIKGDLPMLKYVRGAKAKVSFDGFSITVQNNQAIFDRGKGIFHSRAQVDRIAWYIGSKILELAYKEGSNTEHDKFTSIMEEREKENMLYDKFKIIKISFDDLLERHLKGYVDEDELKKAAMDYINAFDDDKNKMRVKNIIEDLLSENSIARIQARVRKQRSRRKSKIDNISTEIFEN